MGVSPPDAMHATSVTTSDLFLVALVLYNLCSCKLINPMKDLLLNILCEMNIVGLCPVLGVQIVGTRSGHEKMLSIPRHCPLTEPNACNRLCMFK